MKKMFTFKRIAILIGVMILAGSIFAIYEWNKPARDVSDETAIAVTAQEIFDGYSQNEAESNKKWLDKAIMVTGKVKGIQTNQDGKIVVTLNTSDPMFGVQATMKEKVELKEGDLVKIKGICTGYLVDVVLVDCYLIK